MTTEPTSTEMTDSQKATTSEGSSAYSAGLGARARRGVANALAAAWEKVSEPHPAEPDWEVLRMGFEQHESGATTFNAELQHESARFVAFCAMSMLGNAPNFTTSTLHVTGAGDPKVYELTVGLTGGKTPADRIAELEAEVARLKGT